MASINREEAAQEKSGYAVMAAAMTYGEGSIGDGLFGEVSHAAKLFMIGFACVLPVVLVWRYLL